MTTCQVPKGKGKGKEKATDQLKYSGSWTRNVPYVSTFGEVGNHVLRLLETKKKQTYGEHKHKKMKHTA